MIKSADIKIKRMYQSECGASWPVYEVRIMNKGSDILLCKCEAENTNDKIGGLKKAKLIQNALRQQIIRRIIIKKVKHVKFP
jgi:hypothetical protein